MRRRRYVVSLAAVVFIGAVLGNPVPALAQEFVMKLAHVVNPGSPRDKLMHLYGKNLGERTNGRIKVQVYPSAQLGDNRQIIEGIQVGTIEGTISPTAFLGGFEPLLTIFDLPYLFPNIDIASNVANSNVGMAVAREVESKGIKGLAFYGEGEKNLVTNFPVRRPADFQGKKFRSFPTPVLLEQFRAWGANPVPIELGETYNALAQGVVVGQEQEWGLVNDFRFYEVSKYLTQSEHGFLVEFFFVSKKWFDRLPEDLQKAVVAEAQALIPVRLQWAKDYNGKAALDKLLAAHKDLQFYKLTKEEQDAFRAASLPVQRKYVEQTGPKGAQHLENIKAKVVELSR
jgi:tripartite ATP-independent transporter DctP family solute receptor